MKHKIISNWQGGLKFEADLYGHKLVTDAPVEGGGENSGPTPKVLMMAALAGCTGMDAVSILKKMRVDLQAFNVTVEAEMRDEHPKYYEKMHVIYEFTGKDLPLAKLEKAVNLSKEQYCGVEAVYKRVMEMTHEIRIVEVE